MYEGPAGCRRYPPLRVPDRTGIIGEMDIPNTGLTILLAALALTARGAGAELSYPVVGTGQTRFYDDRGEIATPTLDALHAALERADLDAEVRVVAGESGGGLQTQMVVALDNRAAGIIAVADVPKASSAAAIAPGKSS